MFKAIKKITEYVGELHVQLVNMTELNRGMILPILQENRALREENENLRNEVRDLVIEREKIKYENKLNIQLERSKRIDG